MLDVPQVQPFLDTRDEPLMTSRPLPALLLAVIVSLCGCASLPPGKTLDPQDPFERFNRASDGFNETLDKAMLKPVAKAYKTVTPGFVQTGIANFFGNLSDIPTAFNDVLQARPKAAVVHVARVGINSTIGLLGLIDFATGMGLPRERQDFGLTFGAWGADSGPYLVLPLLGPSSVRDAAGLPLDWATDPVMLIRGDIAARNTAAATRAIDRRAGVLGADQVVEDAAFDKYLLVRDAYLAHRKSRVEEGAKQSSTAPEPSKD
jgi:phospholipid-binding lipoprotein MlaA